MKKLPLLKLSHFIVMSSFLQFGLIFLMGSFAVAHPTAKGQEILEKKITFNLTNSSFKEVLTEIEQGARIKFSYNSRLSEMNKKISIQAQNESVSSVLD